MRHDGYRFLVRELLLVSCCGSPDRMNERTQPAHTAKVIHLCVFYFRAKSLTEQKKKRTCKQQNFAINDIFGCLYGKFNRIKTNGTLFCFGHDHNGHIFVYLFFFLIWWTPITFSYLISLRHSYSYSTIDTKCLSCSLYG